MKKIIVCIIVALCSLFIRCTHEGEQKATTTSTVAICFEHPRQKVPINIVYFQDGSQSIRKNGVEIIEASVFYPYYCDIHRDIVLNFGIINACTPHKLITVELPKATFRKPIQPDINALTLTEQNALKRQYAEAELQYQNDSIQFFADRLQRFHQFCIRADSSLIPYRVKLSTATDIAPVFRIADKVFTFSFTGPTKNYLLLNTDGLDTRTTRIQNPMRNKAEVVLINASGLAKTSIDAAVTTTLQSTEQAIEYTLSKNK